MIINVLNENFKKIYETDDYVSLIWCKRYNDLGGLDLELPATIETLQTFKKNYYITRDDDDSIFRITNIELNTDEDGENTLVIGATDCLSILNQRINNNVSYEEGGTVKNAFRGTYENYIRTLINKNFINSDILTRNIKNLVLGSSKGYKETLEIALDFVNVGEETLTVCRAHNCGCKITWKNSKFVFDLFQGVDRSEGQLNVPPVVFSPEFGNLIKSKYTVENDKIKNSIIPYQSVDTSDKYSNQWAATSDVITGEISGLDRYEIKVDIKEIISGVNSGEISNLNIGLETAFKKELASNTKSKVKFEGELSSDYYIYKQDWDLGDIVTVKNDFGIKANARIVEVIETWDREGYTIEPVFDFEDDIEEVDFAILTENSEVVTTENEEVLIYE